MRMYKIQIVVGEVRTLFISAPSKESAEEIALEVDSEHLEGSGNVDRAILETEHFASMPVEHFVKLHKAFLNGAEGVEVL